MFGIMRELERTVIIELMAFNLNSDVKYYTIAYMADSRKVRETNRGPESAGATPGPACYDEGPLTITDSNL